MIAFRLLLIGSSFAPGKTAYEQGRMEEALGLLDRAVEEAPQPDAYLYRALTRMELGDARGARSDFDRSLALRPESAMAHYHYGDLLLSAGELEAAHRHLEHALRIDPGYAWARQRMGDLWRKRGKTAEAAAFYQASALADPGGGSWHSLGDLWLEGGDRPRAVEAFEKDLMSNPACYEARINAAAIYLGTGDLWSAVEHYGVSLRYHPGDARARHGLERAQRSITLRWLALGAIPALVAGLLLGTLLARRRRRG